GDARDEVAEQHDLDLALAHHAGYRGIARVVHLGNDVIRLRAPGRAVGDRQDRLDDVGGGLVPFGGEHDDRARGLHAHHVEVGGVDGAAGATDDAGGLGIADALADGVLHLHLVLFGED